MPNHFKYLLDLRFWLAVIMLAGCVGAPLTVEMPPWYLQDSGAYLTTNGRVFHGIGEAQGSSSATLLRAAAANRARKQMAQVLDLYVSKGPRKNKITFSRVLKCNSIGANFCLL